MPVFSCPLRFLQFFPFFLLDNLQFLRIILIHANDNNSHYRDFFTLFVVIAESPTRDSLESRKEKSMKQLAKVTMVATIFGLGMNAALADMPKVINIAYVKAVMKNLSKSI